MNWNELRIPSVVGAQRTKTFGCSSSVSILSMCNTPPFEGRYGSLSFFLRGLPRPFIGNASSLNSIPITRRRLATQPFTHSFNSSEFRLAGSLRDRPNLSSETAPMTHHLDSKFRSGLKNSRISSMPNRFCPGLKEKTYPGTGTVVLDLVLPK
jgi:hypothetical protein